MPTVHGGLFVAIEHSVGRGYGASASTAYKTYEGEI